MTLPCRDGNVARPGLFRPGPARLGPARPTHFMRAANTGPPRPALGLRAGPRASPLFLIFF